MATAELTQQFHNLIKECTQTPIDKLLVNPDWGSISFDGCRPELERTYSMLNQFRLLPLEVLPDNLIRKIVATCPVPSDSTPIAR
ncbi:hypothetical protein FACS189441_3020 [Betaproteobacteria bacterium]|nr:hypothetical protein FACS189441_3020 [Betaproteobacteria bacterium]